MKNNSLLTYVLYGLLGLILIIAGYYACQKQKDQKLKKEQDEAELQQTLRDMGYAHADSAAAATGSSFASGDTISRTKGATSRSVTDKNGIETDSKGATATTKTGKQVAPAPIKPIANTTKPGVKVDTKTTGKTSITAAKPVAKKSVASTTAKGVKGPGTGRWAVRAGTFAHTDGARRRLEQVIKLGYPNAEISKTSDGKAAVVVFRSNDKTAAIRIADQLENKGVDAAVFDRKN